MTNSLQKYESAIVAIDKISKEAEIARTTLDNTRCAFMYAEFIGQLKSLLTPQIMQPIMNLQGNKLGFLTDKDSIGGYSVDVVRNCFIESVIIGLSPANNEWNIIAGNLYITKNGMGKLLKNIPNLKCNIIPSIPKIQEGGALINAQIEWKYKDEANTKTIPFAIKLNKGMGADAIIGKLKRKARAWLYEYITGMEVSEGEIEDLPSRTEKDVTPLRNAIDTPPEAPQPVITTQQTMKQIIEELPPKISLQEVIQELKIRGTIDSNATLEDFENSPQYEFVREGFRNKNMFFKSIINAIIDKREEQK